MNPISGKPETNIPALPISQFASCRYLVGGLLGQGLRCVQELESLAMYLRTRYYARSKDIFTNSMFGPESFGATRKTNLMLQWPIAHRHMINRLAYMCSWLKLWHAPTCDRSPMEYHTYYNSYSHRLYPYTHPKTTEKRKNPGRPDCYLCTTTLSRLRAVKRDISFRLLDAR
jgi:hypothetical protein